MEDYCQTSTFKELCKRKFYYKEEKLDQVTDAR